MFTPEIRQAAIEGRRTAIPKRAYSQAIKAFCLECWGFNPSIRPCPGSKLQDGEPCRLYAVNTREKRLKVTKSALKRGIKAECVFCLGTPRGTCTSPRCPLYPFRMN